MLILLNYLWQYKKVREAKGTVSALFILLYGVFRIAMEQFREPDAQLGFLIGSATMGQLLSVPLIIVGAYILYRNYKSSFLK